MTSCTRKSFWKKKEIYCLFFVVELKCFNVKGRLQFHSEWLDMTIKNCLRAFENFDYAKLPSDCLLLLYDFFIALGYKIKEKVRVNNERKK